MIASKPRVSKVNDTPRSAADRDGGCRCLPDKQAVTPWDPHLSAPANWLVIDQLKDSLIYGEEDSRRQPPGIGAECYECEERILGDSWRLQFRRTCRSLQCTSELAPCSTRQEGGCFSLLWWIQTTSTSVCEGKRERERECCRLCRRRGEGEIWHVFSGGERGWEELRVCVCKPSMAWRRRPGTRLNKYKVVLENPSLGNHRIMSSGVRVCKNKERRRTEAENKWEGVRGERQRRGDVVVISCKGVAQDNRLSSEWRTQKGLRLIAGCDKERGEEIKPSRQNYVSQRSKKDPLTAHSHTAA